METEANEHDLSPPFCTIVGVDMNNFCYSSCSLCERPLPSNHQTCSYCTNHSSSNPSSTRLFRILLSVATSEKVMVVICFDRAARVLFGCSADELFGFCASHPSACKKAGEILEGEMFQMKLSRPKNGNAQHLRVVSVVPLRTGFHPVIHTLRHLYRSVNPAPAPAPGSKP